MFVTVLLIAAACGSAPAATPTPEVIPTATPPTPSPTAVVTPTSSPTLEPTAAPTATPDTPPAGPPFPPPINDVVVYDYANILSPATEQRATDIIVGIEHRVGAEVVVYTQYKLGSDEASTEQDALTLINQWGVGRKGFDDGLAIMWNTNRRECLPGVPGNGQVQLYGAPGYAAAYLSNGDRQAIFDNDMLPNLRQCDEDGALLAALAKIDAAAPATPQPTRLPATPTP
jgi:uncharacterized membrane protein YgcG